MPRGTSPTQITWAVAAASVSCPLYLALFAIERQFFEGSSSPTPTATLVTNVVEYSLVTLALYAVYGVLLVGSHRAMTPQATRFLVIAAVGIHVAWSFARPYFSDDLFSYLMYGYIGTLPGGNPHVQPLRDMADSSFGRLVATYRWAPIHGPSPYGPVWTHIQVATLRLTQDVPTGMLILKSVVTLASLANAALIYDIANKIAPRSGVGAALAYLWHPLIITQFAAEGHNDALMITFVLGSIALSFRRRDALAVTSLLLGVLTKFLPALLLPPVAIFLWRRSGLYAVRRIVTGAVIAITFGVLLYSPFWAGAATFGGVREIRWESIPLSHAGMLRSVFSSWLSWSTSNALTGLITGSTMLAVVAISCWRLRTPSDLLRACSIIAVTYTLVGSPIHYAWYATFPATMLVLYDRPLSHLLSILLSCGGQLTIPFGHIYLAKVLPDDWVIWGTALISLTLPVLTWLIIVALTRARSHERASPRIRR